MAPHPHLARTPWPAEDGGPERLQAVHGVTGPRATTGRVAAVRHDPVCVMALHAPDDRLLLLRAAPAGEGASWVEQVDPETLAVVARSADLPLGPFWPGGMGVLADGAVVVVQGCWAHRLAPDLTVERARRLPVEAPYNSFVVLDDGTIATKDLQRPTGTASVLSALDPVTLEDRAAPLPLPEPSVARLSARGDELVVVGCSALHRLRWSEGRWAEAAAPLRYLQDEGQSFGWDAVVTGTAVWWMDNGDHTFTAGLTMLGNGVATGPVRLWRADRATSALASVEVSGLPAGAVTNPPLVDEARGLVVAFDSANGVLAAFGIADLAPRWRIPCATAQHLLLYADTGELIADDHDREAGDALVVVDVETGDVRCRVPIGSPAQSVVFGAPGPGRDVIYVSLSTVARVAFA